MIFITSVERYFFFSFFFYSLLANRIRFQYIYIRKIIKSPANMKIKITMKTGKFSYFPASFAFHPLSFRLPFVRKLSTLSMLSLFHRYNRNSLIRWNEFSGFSWWSIDPWLENFHCSSEIFFFLFFSLFFFFFFQCFPASSSVMAKASLKHFRVTGGNNTDLFEFFTYIRGPY